MAGTSARPKSVSWSSGLAPQLRPWFEWLAQEARRVDGTARVTSAYRSRSEQERLYRRFLAGQSRYPVARPGTSRHEHGRAIDLVARPEVLRWLGKLWESKGGRWGGELDPIHFDA